MAVKLYTEAGGQSKQVRKLYTEVNGTAHLVKKLYAEVNGVSKLVYALDAPFTFGFNQYYYNTIALNSYCELSSWFCGYRSNGLPGMDIVCWNATGYTDGAPTTKIDINFVNPDALVGKTITVNFTADIDTDGDNEFWYQWRQNGSLYYGYLGSWNGQSAGFGRLIERGTTSLEIAMRTGEDGNHGAHVTIQSILLDGVQVFP